MSLPEETLRTIIAAAQLAPSGDNVQPFCFRQDESGLTIFLDKKRAKHSLDIAWHASHLALGCTIECCQLAAAKMGLATEYVILPLESPAVSQIARLQFVPQKVFVDPLSAYMPLRVTDRNFYLPGITLEQIHHTVAACKTNANIHFSFAPPKIASANLLMELENIFLTNRTLHHDLMRWIRFKNSSKDGMPWQTLGIPGWQAAVLWATRFWPLQVLTNLLGGVKVAQIVWLQKLYSSSALILISTPSSTNVATIVETGRQAYRMWLALTAIGCGVQPISLGVLLNYARQQSYETEITLQYKTHLERLAPLLFRDFALRKDHTLLWLFRAGKTRQQLPIHAPRLPLEEVIIKNG